MPARSMILLSWNRISDAMYQSLGIKRLRHECLKTKHLDFVTRYSVTVLKTKTGTRPQCSEKGHEQIRTIKYT